MTTMRRGNLTANIVNYDEVGEIVYIRRGDNELVLPITELDNLVDLIYDVHETQLPLINTEKK